MANSDLYQVLGVSRSASADEIRKAYKKLARENHPDVKKDDPAAAERFKEVQEAYDVLGDTEKRQQYDRFGTTFPKGGPPPGPGGGPGGGRTYTWSSGGAGGGFDFGDLFGGGVDLEELLGGGRRSRGGPRPARGSDIEAAVKVSFETAVQGGNVDIQVEHGHQQDHLTVKIPAGVDTGSVIRLAGQGQPGRFSGPPGDLLLKIEVQPHRYFRREGSNLLIDVPITPSEAVLGSKVEVPTLSEGLVVVTIPPGTSSGAKLRLRGKGAVDPQTKQPGDQYVVVKIVVPREATEAIQQLYEQLRPLEAPPRTGLW